VQLTLSVSSRHGPLFRQVYSALREAILTGGFRVGDRLPSSRDLADQLGVSRTVVLAAYDQLLAEGFAEGRRGSGTYVASGIGGTVTRPRRAEQSAKLRLARFGSAAAAASSTVGGPRERQRPLPYDFAYGRSDVELFPLEMWRRILLRCARKMPLSGFDYGPASGNVALREAISVHLRRSRAVACDPSQIVIVNGSQQGLDLIARVLIERGDRVVIEDPGYQGTTEVLRAAGAHLLPVSVDRDGLNPARLPAGARIAFVTPSHQFPTGAILSLARRLALLDWAKRENAVLVEDDYDGEFRYEGQPVESLQGLDREGRVVYIGTFSRTVFPSLRIGYVIAPTHLVPAFTGAKWLADRQTATLEQQALAEFISSGLYERYLRRVRRRNTARRAALLDAIATNLGDRVEVTGDGAGTHVALWPRRRISEDALIVAAASRGVRIYGMSRYFQRRPSRPGFILGYSRITEREIREGIRRLGETL
jgi:GntR family transcriptional regulator/MocR family aminotransferase